MSAIRAESDFAAAPGAASAHRRIAGVIGARGVADFPAPSAMAQETGAFQEALAVGQTGLADLARLLVDVSVAAGHRAAVAVTRRGIASGVATLPVKFARPYLLKNSMQAVLGRVGVEFPIQCPVI